MYLLEDILSLCVQTRILLADHQTYQNIHAKGKCYYANKNSFITNISITKVGVYTEIAAVSFTRCFDC